MLESMKIRRGSKRLPVWRRVLAMLACCLAIFIIGAPPVRAAEPVPDKTGTFQTTPTPASVPGYTKLDPKKMTAEEIAGGIDAVAQSSSHNYFSINFVWVLVAGFLVIFMQAGFALVETGLCRAKNAAHTMSMNFLVYALGMFGFFVSGFALMCGGMNGTAIGGPASLGGLPTLTHMFTTGAGVNGDHGWGWFGTTGFFLTGAGYDAGAIVMFLFMMAFMDTTATIVTGACAEPGVSRASLFSVSSSAASSIQCSGAGFGAAVGSRRSGIGSASVTARSTMRVPAWFTCKAGRWR